MKTKIIPEQRINLYEFDELTPEIQNHVINTLFDINVDYNWWDLICADAENIGLKITGFDIERKNHCTGNFLHNPIDCAEKILKEYGENCETYKTALMYLPHLKAIKDNFAEVENEFLNDLLEDYRILLKNEYEYRTSREGIVETIKANEYLFRENGSIEPFDSDIIEENANIDIITITWHKDDVIQRAEEVYDFTLSDDEAREILRQIEASHDCNIGINWDVLDYHINDYIKK